eukprot:CAMPEP_0177530202 /NCGR_PEP_ID=MMETSP0369-20130122/53256_1 /TAXON_ID=447022 ORGANISM="Scrippsiella hangoei-like, Strain SHHI-4" /NCGR_SAMPLE_ID=MMETSP0369 /ASSEMBLY_ACC=CAM_ASM_000364 /LENGTH=74 /DNA_ID=CAMNT_0019011007 /DNA_START=485 /DNA_END=709 /DNA_ORIENTATION=+
MATLVQLDRKACLRHCSSGQDAERADDDEHSKPFQESRGMGCIGRKNRCSAADANLPHGTCSRGPNHLSNSIAC